MNSVSLDNLSLTVRKLHHQVAKIYELENWTFVEKTHFLLKRFVDNPVHKVSSAKME